ncbi:chondroitin 6-sulfotransferase [Mactra antiquata]
MKVIARLFLKKLTENILSGIDSIYFDRYDEDKSRIEDTINSFESLQKQEYKKYLAEFKNVENETENNGTELKTIRKEAESNDSEYKNVEKEAKNNESESHNNEKGAENNNERETTTEATKRRSTQFTTTVSSSSTTITTIDHIDKTQKSSDIEKFENEALIDDDNSHLNDESETDDTVNDGNVNEVNTESTIMYSTKSNIETTSVTYPNKDLHNMSNAFNTNDTLKNENESQNSETQTNDDLIPEHVSENEVQGTNVIQFHASDKTVINDNSAAKETGHNKTLTVNKDSNKDNPNTDSEQNDNSTSIISVGEEKNSINIPNTGVDMTRTTEDDRRLTNHGEEIENIENEKQTIVKFKMPGVKGKIPNTYTASGNISNTGRGNENMKVGNSKPDLEIGNENKKTTESKTNEKNSPKQNRKFENDGRNNVEVLSNKKIAIVLAYMRTGSTLTGAILQQYDETFYAFEPIRSIKEKVMKRGGILNYINGTKRFYSSPQYEGVVLNEIKSWLTCDLSNLSVQTLTDDFVRFSRYMKKFRECYLAAKESNSEIRIHKCLQNAKLACERAPLIVLKFIRLSMQFVAQLLPYFPSMKIVHLVRDPRGIYNSRKRVWHSYVPENCQPLCAQTWEDLKTSEKLDKTYPGRIKMLYYEDMAQTPLVKSKALSNFVGIHFTQEMKQFVISQTSAKKDNCNFCTARADSTATSTQWRKTVRFEESKIVYDMCEKSNKYLGYLPFYTATNQRNLKFPSRKQYITERTI